MNVLVYSGPNFSEHEICYAGWMTRACPNSNEFFDAKSVAQKVDLRSACRNVIAVVFDLVERKAIWLDIKTASKQSYGGNNVESNKATIEEKVKAIIDSNNKLSLYELFYLHACARGELVDSAEQAETVFSIEQGIGPYDIDTINAEFIV